MVRIRKRLQDRCYKHHHKHLGFPLAQKLLPKSGVPQTTSYHQLPEIIIFSIMQNPTSKEVNLEKLSTIQPGFEPQKHHFQKNLRNYDESDQIKREKK